VGKKGEFQAPIWLFVSCCGTSLNGMLAKWGQTMVMGVTSQMVMEQPNTLEVQQSHFSAIQQARALIGE
jgi:predicted phage tail protein